MEVEVDLTVIVIIYNLAAVLVIGGFYAFREISWLPELKFHLMRC